MLERDLLPTELQERVDRELRDGEELVWTGRPVPGLVARSEWRRLQTGLPLFLFGCFWTVMTLSMTLSRPTSGPGFASDWLFPLIGAGMTLVGLGICLSPMYFGHLSKKTYYALTDERAIVSKVGFRGSVTTRSYRVDEMPDFGRRERRDGSGDLIFRVTRWIEQSSDNSRKRILREGYIGIRDVREVEGLVRATLGM